jgi:hypothetical protein
MGAIYNNINKRLEKDKETKYLKKIKAYVIKDINLPKKRTGRKKTI